MKICHKKATIINDTLAKNQMFWTLQNRRFEYRFPEFIDNENDKNRCFNTEFWESTVNAREKVTTLPESQELVEQRLLIEITVT